MQNNVVDALLCKFISIIIQQCVCVGDTYCSVLIFPDTIENTFLGNKRKKTTTRDLRIEKKNYVLFTISTHIHNDVISMAISFIILQKLAYLLDIMVSNLYL